MAAFAARGAGRASRGWGLDMTWPSPEVPPAAAPGAPLVRGGAASSRPGCRHRAADAKAASGVGAVCAGLLLLAPRGRHSVRRGRRSRLRLAARGGGRPWLERLRETWRRRRGRRDEGSAAAPVQTGRAGELAERPVAPSQEVAVLEAPRPGGWEAVVDAGGGAEEQAGLGGSLLGAAWDLKEESHTESDTSVLEATHNEQLPPRKNEQDVKEESHTESDPSALEAMHNGQLPSRKNEEALDIVQFDTAIYYVEEDEGELQVDIIRLGRMRGPCTVHWRTEDASAKSGDRYVGASGSLTFEDGEVSKTITIQIINTEEWNTTLEFLIRLVDPEDCELGRYLFVSRVKVMDNDAFPTNRFAKEFANITGPGGIHEVGVRDLELLIEYFKLNYSFDGIAWQTWATLGIDVLGNLYYFLTINLLKYVADDVLGPNPGNPLIVPGNREATLLVVGGLYLVPYGIVNLLDLWKAQLGLAETSRSRLQENIFRKFMNYGEELRGRLRGSEMGLVMVSDANDLVENGYMKMFEIAKNFGRFAVSSYFIIAENPDALGALVISASSISAFVLLNYRGEVEIMEEVSRSQASVMEVVLESSDKYRLIADYYIRPQIQKTLERQINRLNETTVPSKVTDVKNGYFPGWISSILVAAYISFAGEGVVTGSIQIGAFLATINAVKDAGESFKDIFTALLDVGKSIGPIQKITELLNMPTCLDIAKKTSLELRRITRYERRPDNLAELRRQTGQRFGTDGIPIQLRNVSFQFWDSKVKVIKNANLSVAQGKCVAVLGSRRGGKSTLIRLLGQVYSPTEGVFFVPSYLRILHVSDNPMILSGSLWKNFAIGKVYWRDPEAEVQRMLRICRRLGFGSRLLEMLESTKDSFLRGDSEDLEEAQKAQWQRTLSSSDRSLITIARALIYNPEVLVMNRPTAQLSDTSAAKVFELLREFVRNRGVELPAAGRAKRRPRTAFISFVRMAGVAIADNVWSVEDGVVTELDKERVSEIQVS